MADTFHGPIAWNLSQDKEGHRDYVFKFRLETDSIDNGPYSILNSAALPFAIGDPWNLATLGVGSNDNDSYALCLPQFDVEPDPQQENEKGFFWICTNYFSTRPLNRCQDNAVENPLDEPDRISGSFVKYTIEADEDRNGKAIVNSAHEKIRGSAVEFDANRPTVVIEQNVADLELDVFSEMIDTLNDATLWGLDARKIKLSNVPWSRKLYGTCTYYFTRRLEFDINYDTFDREIIDEGSKCLQGNWVKAGGIWTWVNAAGVDKTRPTDFQQMIDPNLRPTRGLLDGNGNPLTGLAPNPVQIPTSPVEYYEESNFLLLDVPTSFV